MTRLSPREVLVLVENRDGTALNLYIRNLSWDTWEEHLGITYGDQDFSSWERYHTWLMYQLRRESLGGWTR